jgi:hypothetical protein
MSLTSVLIALLTIGCIVWALLIPIGRRESFGSDWNAAFWGPMIWTGWNYGYPIGREAPRPEATKPF